MLEHAPLIVTTAALTSFATYAINFAIARRFSSSARTSSPRSPAPTNQSIAETRKTRKRVLRPEQVACLFAETKRFEDSAELPILPGDLDDDIDRWCDENEVERVSTPVVRELFAALPFVHRRRIRLNLRNPAHRYVRKRQELRGEVNDRPTVYVVDNLPDNVADSPATVRPEANLRPTSGLDDRSSVRPKVGQRPATRPLVGQEPAEGWRAVG